jgi:hypothetical protein
VNTTQSTAPGVQSAPSKYSVDDHIDMIDVLGFLWRARIWVITGVTIGIVGLLVLVHSKKPSVYITSLPTTLEVVASLTTDGTVAKFSQFIDRPDIKAELPGVELIGGKMPFKLVSSGNSLALEVSRVSADPSGDAAIKAAEALTNAARSLNKKMTEAAKSAGSAISQTSQGADIESEFAKLAQMQASEEAPVKAKLFALEARLAQKSGAKPLPAMIVNASAVSGTSVGDDVLRLLGALDGKVTPAEQVAVIAEYSSLVGQIRAIQAKYVQPITEMTAGMVSLSSGIIKSATGDIGGVPVVVVDEAAFKASVAAGTHERYESKRALFIALGVILGGMLGLMAYGVRLFIAENRDRIQKIFA